MISYSGIPQSMVPKLLELKEPTVVHRKSLGGGVFDVWYAIPIRGGVTVKQWIECPRVTTQGPPIRFYY